MKLMTLFGGGREWEMMTGFGDDFIDVLSYLKGIKHSSCYAEMPDCYI